MYTSGMVYANQDAQGTWMDLLTFQLNEKSSVSSFTVWILDSTLSNTASVDLDNNVAIKLTCGSASVTQTTVQTDVGLEWTAFHVTGATKDDVFTLSAACSSEVAGNFRNIAGITFETVPEPATWAMMVGGLGVLLGANRFRKPRLM